MLVALEDYPKHDEIPTPRRSYRLILRRTTDPRAELRGLKDSWSLTDRDGRIHCGWVQEKYRAEIEAQMAAVEMYNGGQEEEDHIMVEIEVGNLFKAYNNAQGERDAEGRVFNREY